VELLQDFTQSRQKLNKALHELEVNGKTTPSSRAAEAAEAGMVAEEAAIPVEVAGAAAEAAACIAAAARCSTTPFIWRRATT
jgi:hypothetical protein